MATLIDLFECRQIWGLSLDDIIAAVSSFIFTNQTERWNMIEMAFKKCVRLNSTHPEPSQKTPALTNSWTKRHRTSKSFTIRRKPGLCGCVCVCSAGGGVQPAVCAPRAPVQEAARGPLPGLRQERQRHAGRLCGAGTAQDGGPDAGLRPVHISKSPWSSKLSEKRNDHQNNHWLT